MIESYDWIDMIIWWLKVMIHKMDIKKLWNHDWKYYSSALLENQIYYEIIMELKSILCIVDNFYNA